MKKILKCFILVLLLAVTLTLTGCFESNKNYVAESEFFYSSDGGKTYGNRTKEFFVGEKVYMQLVVRVRSSSRNQDKIGVVLTIPYIKEVVAKYLDGQPITPEVDEFNHETSYPFSVPASKTSKEMVFIFQFIPVKATTVTMKLEFDNQVDSVYDKQNTVMFQELAFE